MSTAPAAQLSMWQPALPFNSPASEPPQASLPMVAEAQADLYILCEGVDGTHAGVPAAGPYPSATAAHLDLPRVIRALAELYPGEPVRLYSFCVDHAPAEVTLLDAAAAPRSGQNDCDEDNEEVTQ